MEKIKVYKSIDHPMMNELEEGVNIQIKKSDGYDKLYQVDVYIDIYNGHRAYLSSYLLDHHIYDLLNNKYSELSIELE